MKQQLKQLMLTVLVALCSITMFSHDFEVDGMYYNFNDDGTSVAVTYRGTSHTSYTDRYTGAVIIPETVTYDGTTYDVTVIGQSAFDQCRNLQSITIPSSVTTIDNIAFWGCTSLTSVNIPASVTSIGSQAFQNCSALTVITIPANVTSIGNNAFYGCTSLACVVNKSSLNITKGSSDYGYVGYYAKSITFEEATDGFWYSDNTKTELVAYTGTSSNVVIPSTVTSIGTVFRNNNHITSVTIPNGVTAIDNYAFSGCSSLAAVIIGSSVKSIGSSAFNACNNLTRIIMLSPTVSIEWSAFYCSPTPTGRVTYIRNSNITKDYFGTTVVCSNQIFTVDGFTYMITDVSAKTCSMISYDGDATDVTVPATVPFNNGRVELTVTGVGQSAFARNNTVQSITFNNSGSIGAYACNDCSALQSLSIGNSAISVGDYAFNGCSALISLTIGRGITWIRSNVLDGTTSLTGADVAKGNETYSSLDGVICSKDGTRILVAPKGITGYTIPGSVTSIADYAFQGCTALTGIEVPANVTSIGQYAFSGCSNLETANINASGTIGYYAFCDATNLTSLTIGNNVTSIYSYAFAGASKLTELRIPHSVTAIGESAFSGCSALETLYLGEHLKTIGKQAFLNCTKLVDITSTNVTPPTCASEAFSGVDGTLCEVNVRDEAVAAYSVANGWKDFWFLQGYTINYIEKQPTSDDVSVVMHNTKEEVTYQWYNSNSLSLMGTGTYPWEKQVDGSWKSTNKGVSSSTSSMAIENLTVKSGDKLTFDYTVSSESGYDKLSVYWNGNAILSNISGNTSASFSYTFPADKTAILEFRYSKDSGVDSGSDCATISNVKINGTGTGAFEAIPGATDAALDLSTLSNINRVYCIVTLSDGIQLKSDVVEVSTESKPTYSVASHKGNSSTENSTLDIDQIKGLTLQDNEMVYVDANIGTVMPTNIVKKNGEGKWVAKEIELTDGVPFYNPSDVLAEVISYTRDFTTANWQALYVPFDVQYEDWADKADVAYINDVHQFDDDEDGRVERTVIEYLYKRSGAISANKPYLIRPKQTGEMTLTSHNTTLKATPATGGSVDCSSTTMLYTLTGTYQSITDMYDKHWYALSDGALRQASHSGVTLAPFRFYLNITDRNGNPVSDIDRPSYVRLMIGGLMIDEETGIEMPDATNTTDGKVYDLQGRRVEHPKHGLYIIGGKKTIIK